MHRVSMHPKWASRQEKSGESLVNTSADSLLTTDSGDFRELMRCGGRAPRRPPGNSSTNTRAT